MKKMMLMALAAAFMCGCEKPILDAESENEVALPELPHKNFTFTVKGDFGSATFTRAYLSADGQSMTDLWVFDYVGNDCVQTVHQATSDADWGQPKMSLAYGSHHIYFVASRGEGATLDADGHTITWTGPRDTFWKDYQVDVVSTSNGNRAVTLDRVATKFKATINDEVPAACEAVVITPSRWYYGWDYVNGIAVAQQQTDRTINVPASYIGTTGQLVLSIFGLSGADEWVTNVAVKAVDASDNTIGSATITGAPFKSNRSTEYNGNLFGSSGGFDVSVNANWESPKTGTW
jgi:hypothetical protein